ncbi:MAG: ATP-binding protein [Chloroflexi bacterium]|nr:ATP-binding protein [Chloroflexota bacterium]
MTSERPSVASSPPVLDPAIERGIGLVHELLRLEVARLRAEGVPVGEDEYRGLYTSDSEADRLLDAGARLAVAEGAGFAAARASIDALIAEGGGPLRSLARLGSLSPFEAGVLLLCLASEADLGTERLIGYVQDDVTKKRPRVDLALRLLAGPGEMTGAREAFAAGGALRRLRLVALHDEPGQPHTPLLARSLALDPRIAGYLLGETVMDESLHAFATRNEGADASSVSLPPALAEQAAALAALPATRLSPPVIAFSGPDPAAHRALSRQLAASAGLSLITVDFAELALDIGFEAASVVATREGALQEAAVLLEGVDRLPAADGERLTTRLRDEPVAPLVLLASRGAFNWPGLTVALPGLDFEALRTSWQRHLDGEQVSEDDLTALAGKFRLASNSITAAVAGARGHARWRDPENPVVRLEDLYAAARTQSTPILSDLARKIVPHYAWDDIVLPADARQQLREMCSFVEHRHLVYDVWGLGRKLAMGKGLMALFAGNSGTGKTMAADVMAGTLALDLYKIDLSGVVSKYIGETEKNLGSIFAEAETSNAILFFDEADALFGKRSEVKDAHDRYANIETAYLLQKMEEYSGVVILATNLKMNLDEAFLRRLHFVIDFPMPEEDDRKRIWQSTLPPGLPLAEDLDLSFLARQFKIAGGNIRNIVLAAAFLAASEGSAVGMSHCIRGVRREYQKLGRMVTDAEFGQYIGLLRE